MQDQKQPTAHVARLMGLAWPWLVRAVGAALLVGVAGKVYAPEAFWMVVRGFGVGLPVTVAAVAVTALEAVLGVALLIWPEDRRIQFGTAGLLIGFTLLIPVAQAMGAMTKDCGCFGGLVRTHPLVAIFRNLAFLGVLTWAPAAAGTASRQKARWHLLGMVVAGLVGGYAAKLSWGSGSTLYRYAAGLRGRTAVAIVHHSCPACRNAVARLNRTIETPFGNARVVLWTLDHPSAWPELECRSLPIYPVGAVGLTFIHAAPTLFVVEEGRILARYKPQELSHFFGPIQ